MSAIPDTTGVVTGRATEPLLSRAAIVAVATALLGLVAAWGLPLTRVQQDAVLYAVGVLAPLALALWARRHVNSPATMAKALGQQVRTFPTS